MDEELVEYLAKKRDMLDAICTCGKSYNVFVNKDDCYATCPNCSKKIYLLTCKKCQNGYSYGEDYKTIDKVNGAWTCEDCINVNVGLPTKTVKAYTNAELPAEVKKEDASRALMPKWLGWLIIAGGLVFYFFKNFR